MENEVNPVAARSIGLDHIDTSALIEWRETYKADALRAADAGMHAEANRLDALSGVCAFELNRRVTAEFGGAA